LEPPSFLGEGGAVVALILARLKASASFLDVGNSLPLYGPEK
jgi:hypothetical protein